MYVKIFKQNIDIFLCPSYILKKKIQPNYSCEETFQMQNPKGFDLGNK